MRQTKIAFAVIIGVLLIGLFFSKCYAQLNPCAHRFDIAASLSAGGAWNTYGEIGALGLEDRAGLFAGVINFDAKNATGKYNTRENITSVFIKGTYRLYESELFRVYGSALIGPRVQAVSIRAGIILSDETIFFIEPMYLQGSRVNAGIMFRFN